MEHDCVGSVLALELVVELGLESTDVVEEWVEMVLAEVLLVDCVVWALVDVVCALVDVVCVTRDWVVVDCVWTDDELLETEPTSREFAPSNIVTTAMAATATNETRTAVLLLVVISSVT